MKKLFIAASIAGFLVSSLANAENNNQFSISIINSNVDNTYKSNTGGNNDYNSSDTSNGFGLEYGYRVDLSKKVFVTPGIFYDNIKNTAKESSPTDKESVNSRYGAKIDLGYNIIDKLSAFASIGLANTRYEINWSNNFIKSDSDTSLVYGLGLSYDLNDKFFIKTEYNVQSIEMAAENAGEKYDSNIEVIKASLGYKF